MKIGDMVKMDFEMDDEFHPDEWGVGIIVEIERNGVQLLEASPDSVMDDVLVHWNEIGLSWEMPSMLELVDAPK